MVAAYVACAWAEDRVAQPFQSSLETATAGMALWEAQGMLSPPSSSGTRLRWASSRKPHPSQNQLNVSGRVSPEVCCNVDLIVMS